ncbi:hypothetical protein J7F03_20695 [Streptomyces sp. ISL-43]|uniref:hypothetical protein n=1 Tax=Streptomyces sp. ISL-43 TaxID=2819183 RepID=UPI001BE78A45|nr:hypothetical protein [Streptomyces sp. ISL-43]MBT2449462.1 hypothetical protein [Streptomyces sp. ISL-43]
MISNGDRTDVVLDVYQEDGGYRVVMVGVFEPGAAVPPVPAGATRNVVQALMGLALNVRAFGLGMAAAE